MNSSKADIIASLQRDILQLQGFKAATDEGAVDLGLGPMKDAFPNGILPTGAVHEFLSAAPEHAAATSGFIGCLLGKLMKSGGVCIWVSVARTVFPPALKAFGIESDKIIFVDLKREKDVLWAMEEALKCEGLAAVVGEIKDISFTASRRLQLAVEQSKVTGFIIRKQPCSLNTIASVSRWCITSLASGLVDDMPGVGFPRWNVALLKIRNGKPGEWQLEWSANGFQKTRKPIFSLPLRVLRKTG